MRSKSITATEVESAVVDLLDPRRYVMVPNLSWGLGLHHEADILALDKSGRFTEIEIKVSAGDLRRDFKKVHGHACTFISRLVYALPHELVPLCRKLAPARAGIISVSGAKARWVRTGRHDPARKPDAATVLNFMRLGCMRIWPLKKKIYVLEKQGRDAHARNEVVVPDPGPFQMELEL